LSRLRLKLKDKVVIVTGGANGLGLFYSQHMVGEGADVVIADIDIDAAEASAESLSQKAAHGSATAVQVDVTSEHDVDAMVQTVVDRFGQIDVLINNAGTYPHLEIDDVSYEAWRQVISVNLDSVFLCSKAVLPQMRKQQSGKIINIATNLVWIGLSGMVPYIAAKAGVVGFTRALAREVGDDNITVNALAPGAVIPPIEDLNDAAMQRVESIVSHQAVKWCQRPGDLWGPLLFLATSQSDFMSGQVLTIDGGLTNH